jgi:hypothetical protein
VLLAAAIAPPLIVGLSFAYGLLGVPLGMLIAQTLTVNWYAIYRTVTRMEIAWTDYLKSVAIPWLVTLITALGIGSLSTMLVCSAVPAGRWHDAAVVFAAASAGALALAFAHRSWIRAALRSRFHGSQQKDNCNP